MESGASLEVWRRARGSWRGTWPVSVKNIPWEERLVRRGREMFPTDLLLLSYSELKDWARLAGKFPTDLARGGEGRLMDFDLKIAPDWECWEVLECLT